MNLLLLEPEEIDAHGHARLVSRRARHVRQVIGAGVGDRLRVGVVRGPRGQGTVVAVGEGYLELSVALDGASPQPPPIDVLLALPRPKALLRALETCASFGVRRIDLVNAWRVDKSYFHSSRTHGEAVREHLMLGCEQGETTWLPTCEVHTLLVPFVKEQLVPRLDGEPSTRRFIAHPRAERYLEQAYADVAASGRAVVAIGPERGWIDRELEMFESLGFMPVRLGTPVLRTEAAIAALLAQLSLLARLAPTRAEPEPQ